MNCPGCVKHGLPQAARLAGAFNDDEVAVIGLHTVFEDHDKQTPEALEAFIDELELPFPIAVDKPNGGSLPKTMEAYEIQGTPSVLVFDRQGRLRRHYLGQVDDVRLGAELMALAIEARDAPREQSIAHRAAARGDAGRSRPSITITKADAAAAIHEHDHDHDHAHDRRRRMLRRRTITTMTMITAAKAKA